MDSITKVCCYCKQEKCASEYHRSKAKKHGIADVCKVCQKEKAAAYYQANKEHIKSRVSAYQRSETGKRVHYEASMRYWNQNREKVNAANLEYWRRNKDACRHRLNKWRHANPHKTQAQKQNRRARINGGGGYFTSTQWRRLCRKYNYHCLCCGVSNVKLTVDHIVPISKGGTSNIDNIQPLCRSCNSTKGAKIIDYRAMHDQVRQLSMW